MIPRIWLKRLCILSCNFLLFSNADVRAAGRMDTAALDRTGNSIDFDQFAQELSDLCSEDDPYVQEIVFNADNQECEKDGIPVKTSQEEQAKIEKRNGRYMVSAELLSEAIDGEVQYSEDGNIITVEKGNQKIAVVSGNSIIVSEDEMRHLPEKPYAVNNNMMLPLKDIVQALGLDAVETKEGEIVVTDDFQTKRLIVKSSADIADETAAEIIDGYDDLHILQYDSRKEAIDAYENFQKIKDIEYVQPDGVYSLSDSASEENASGIQVSESAASYHSWGVEKMGMGSYQQYLKDNYSSIPEIVVAVVDTGIDYNNSLFEGRILDNGVNYVSDTSNNGRQRPGNSNSSSTPQDDHWHGTAVSGIIIESTLSNVHILPVKVLDREGKGTDSTVYMGLNYAIEQGADVINMSLGCDGTSTLYEEAVKKAESKGIAVVAAAGNESNDVAKVTPANIKEAITVSSLDSNNGFSSSFSNYGSYVDFAAPGQNIQVVYLYGGYKSVQGTSFSAPHVAAAVALLKSVNYYLEIEEITDILEDNAVDLGSSGWDQYFGYGLIDLSKIERYIGVEGALAFDSDPGTYTGSLSLKLAAEDASAQIYYTTDQTEPSDVNGELYTGPITINTSTQIKAVAYLNGIRWSSIISGSFVIGQEIETGDTLKGDVDGDNKVTAADALGILHFLTEAQELSEAQQAVADVDESGSVTAADALKVLKYVAEIIPVL